MAGNEIRMKVRQEDILDLQSVLLGKCNVLLDIALRVNHDGRAGLLVSNNIGRMSQARQVELFQNQMAPAYARIVISAAARCADTAWEISSRSDISSSHRRPRLPGE